MSDLNSHLMPKDTMMPFSKIDRCPSCGYKVDCATELHHEPIKPIKGDFSICLNCGQLNKFDAALSLVPSTVEDESNLSATLFSEVKKAQAYIARRGIFT